MEKKYVCEFCGKKYDNPYDYVQCVTTCAELYKRRMAEVDRMEREIRDKEKEIREIYDSLKDAINMYHKLGGKKNIFSQLKIDEYKNSFSVKGDASPCKCKKDDIKFDSVWVGTSPAWFSVPSDVKIECYNSAEDVEKAMKKGAEKPAQKPLPTQKPTKKKPNPDDNPLETLVKTLLDIESPKPKKEVQIKSYPNTGVPKKTREELKEDLKALQKENRDRYASLIKDIFSDDYVKRFGDISFFNFDDDFYD